jgi:diacylglycerol O-acyltransferase
MKTDRDTSSNSSPASANPRQLSDSDSVFISIESPTAASHIAGLTIVDPSTSSEFSFERYLQILRERIKLVPRLKWKLFQPPLGFDRAYWVEAEDFDARDHVRRETLRSPGDKAALAQLAGALHAEPLDRTRPLWQCWWIDGLEGDRVAVLLKMHHCLMDGQSGIGLSEILMDLSPEPVRDLQLDLDPDDSPPRRPTLWEIGQAALANGLNRPRAIVVHGQRAIRDGLGRILDAPAEAVPPRVDRVSFNGKLSRERSFATASIPLGPLRDAKKHFNVTMNDVILELVASSLRQGLLAHDALPDSPIVGLCPVSLRRDGDPRFANQISSMPVALATDLPDVSARLTAIHESAEAAKQRLASGAFESLAALGECLVPGALRLLTRVAQELPSLLPLPANLVISNVRGLPVPLYLAGARVEELYPISMLQVANGMNVTAVSHEDQIDFGFLVDPTLVQDPWIYANGIHAALRELEAEVAAHSKTRPQDTASTPPPAAEIENDDEPLNLQLMMAELSHLRAPRHMSNVKVDEV